MTKLSQVFPDVQVGSTVRVHEKIREINAKGEEKERVQIFEGMVIARKHGSLPGSSITVRKIAKGGFGVEKIYPLFAPVISEIEVIKVAKVRRSKLYFTRTNNHKFKEKSVKE